MQRNKVKKFLLNLHYIVTYYFRRPSWKERCVEQVISTNFFRRLFHGVRRSSRWSRAERYKSNGQNKRRGIFFRGVLHAGHCTDDLASVDFIIYVAGSPKWLYDGGAPVARIAENGRLRIAKQGHLRALTNDVIPRYEFTDGVMRTFQSNIRNVSSRTSEMKCNQHGRNFEKWFSMKWWIRVE